MSRFHVLILASLLAVTSAPSYARLVIIQNDEAALAKIEAEKKATAAEEKAALLAKQLDNIKAQETEKRNAQVAIQSQDLNVIADRTEKIIRHYGVAPAQLPAQGGAGLGNPLWVAMNGIVPVGWRVFTDKNVDAQMPVAWNGHKLNWVAILHAIGTEHRLTFDIDWNQLVVIVKPRSSAIDYLLDDLDKKNTTKTINIVVESDGDSPIPEGGEGVLVINGQALKVHRTQRVNK